MAKSKAPRVAPDAADLPDPTVAQAEAAADQFDPHGPGVQEIGEFLVVDPATPEGAAKAAVLDAAALPDGTVSVDFGLGNVLTGCLAMGVHYGLDGMEVNIVVPTASGKTFLIPGVPVDFVK